ncbi:MAG: TonB-dependent receptor [Acidobacteriia bacterium]|nr:TonB-dependent receptor [Terriglobia bacterium]
MTRSLKHVCCASLLVIVLAAVGWGQKDSGTIVGTVKDASGAVLAEAKVTVTDADRGTSFTTATNASGEYVAGPLKVGHYRVAVEKAGFKTTVVGPVELNVQERPSVDVVLRVGEIHEQITVTSQGPQLETENSDLGQVVTAKRISTLPLNGRNYAQLAQLGTGVVPAEPGSRAEKSFAFSSNGARALQNNFLLDGVDNNANLGDVLNETTFVIQPPVDAIAEFKVQTNAYSAEFGRGNGAVMNAVIKSGTNQIHGNVFEFLRNETFDASNAFDQFGRQPYKQNQFGFTLGGPIIKNRTFFFGDYEGLRVRQAIPILLSIPTPEMIAGDFSGSLLGQIAPQLDPATGELIEGSQALDCNGKVTFVGEIFNTRLTQTDRTDLNPNGFCGVPISSNGNLNVFDAGLIDPLAARLAALFPSPNTELAGANFLVNPVRKETRNNFDIRVDHKIAQKDDFFVRFSYEDQPSTIPAPFNNVLDGGGFFDGIEDNSYRSIAISEVHVFTPNLINEFRVGYNRINSHRFQLNFDKDIAGDPQYGINYFGIPFGPLNGGLPEIDFSDGTAIIGSSTFLPSKEIQNTYVLAENLTWIRGRHSIKLGTEIRREQFTIFQPAASRGNLGFGTEFTDNPASPGSGGAAFGSFLLGIPDFGLITSLHNVDYRRQIYAGYFQDDFRITPRLTLNLGLRYEYFSPIKEAHDEAATFDFASQSLIVPKEQHMELTPILGESIPILRTGSRGLIDPDRNNFAPRVGFAFQLTNKAVLRGGYGIFYGGQENGPFSNPSTGFNPPFFSIESFNANCGAPSANQEVGQVDCSIPNFNVMANGFPLDSLSDPNTPLLFSLDPRLRTPYNQQWHFGVQYQLPADTVFEVSYAGSRGLKLFAFYNGNQAVPTADQEAPFAPRRPVKKALPGAGPCELDTPDNCDPAFDTTIATFRSNAFSNYHSLQARLEKRLSHGLQFQGSYTYSHALDTASSANLGSFATGDFRDQRFPNLEYGNADFDIRHRFVFSYAYDLPFGKGQLFGGNATGILNQIIGGWQLAGIISASTGNYFTPTDVSTNLSNSDGGGNVANAARPNRVGDPNTTPCIPGTIFNTCAFETNTVAGTFGNAGRNIIRGPGFQNWDLSIFKNFPLSERYHFEFRAELFNIWNHVNPQPFPGKFLFDDPTTDHDRDLAPGESGCPIDNLNANCSWGFAQSARDPRLVQLALKFFF